MPQPPKERPAMIIIRDHAVWWRRPDGIETQATPEQCATEIERLRAQNEQLKEAGWQAMIRWLRSYIWWMSVWTPWRSPLMRRREGMFSRCCDCKKIMCLSAHLNCIPF
jgi:hypothetical protein